MKPLTNIPTSFNLETHNKVMDLSLAHKTISDALTSRELWAAVEEIKTLLAEYDIDPDRVNKIPSPYVDSDGITFNLGYTYSTFYTYDELLSLFDDAYLTTTDIQKTLVIRRGQVTFTITFWASIPEEEKNLLRDIGKLITIPKESYETLNC